MNFRDIFRSSIPESQGRLGIPDKLGIRGSSPHGIAVDWVEGYGCFTITYFYAFAIMYKIRKLLKSFYIEPYFDVCVYSQN